MTTKALGTSIHGQQVQSSSLFRGLAYSKCEHAWSYLGKISLLTRSMLNAAARNHRIMAAAGRKFPETVKEVATRMKLLSIVGVPFSVSDLSSITRKILNSLSLNDWEGTALGTLSFTVIAADIVDSLTTFINASLTLSSLNPVEAFSGMGLPLGFTMSGLDPDCYLLTGHIRDFFLSRNAQKSGGNIELI